MIDFTAEQYIDDVLSGKQVACHWVRLACERHRNDLNNGKERGLWFDEATARKAIAFFALLKHSKGEFAGRPFILEPCEQFIIGSIFGWKRADGLRRFRTAYLEVGRKNFKTTLGAGVGLYLMLADDEPGAEVYSIATKKDQARLSHSEAISMAKSSLPIRNRVKIFRDNIHIVDTASKFEPLASDEDTLDGLNVHGAIADEIHKWKGRGVWDVIETATGARRQPLMFAITTAGYDRESLCYQQHEYTEKILDGALQDDTWFGIIYTLDKVKDESGNLVDEDWTNEGVWVKANPLLGVVKKWDDMQRKAARAKEMPSQLNAFLNLELDIWTQSVTKWIPRMHWDQCGQAVDAEGLRGRTCYGGLDLSSNTDIAAWVMVFPPQSKDDCIQVLCRFFIPEDAMIERARRDRVPYPAWVRQGFITATPGNVIDYNFIIDQIDQDKQAYDVKEVAFDPWGATKIQTDLMEMGGDDWLVKFSQRIGNFSPPMKDLERLILEHRLAHGNNPVLTWMADNLVVYQDTNENIRPDKEHSTERIDGMVALLMGLDRALRHEAPKKSVYEERGILSA